MAAAADIPAPPPRLSSLALGGAALCLGSIAACAVSAVVAVVATPAAAVVVLALPLVSLAGVLLCVAALRAITRGRGTLVGRPIAIAGILIGGLSAVLQGAAAFGALASVSSIKTDLVPVAEAFVLAYERGDRTACRASLGDAVSAHLDDARLDEFFRTLHDRFGTARGAAFGLGEFLRAAARLRQATANVAPGATIIENPRPIEFRFDRGNAIGWIIPDDATMQSRRAVAIGDILIFLPDDSVLTLRAEGPAASLARRLKWRVAEMPMP